MNSQLGNLQLGVDALAVAAAPSGDPSFSLVPGAGHTAGTVSMTATWANVDAPASLTLSISSGPGSGITGYTKTGQFTATFSFTQTAVSGVPVVFHDSLTSTDESFGTDAVAPGAPAITSVTTGINKITVVFTAPADNGGAAIDLYTLTTSPGGIQATSSVAGSVDILGVNAGTSYTVTAVSHNTAGLTSAPSAPSDSVSPIGLLLTDLVDLRVFQNVSGSASVPITGSRSGSTSAVEARIVRHGTTTEVVTWTQIAASGSGAFSGSLSVPADGYWYNVQVRLATDHTVVASGSNRFGVGNLVLILGQSNGGILASRPGAGVLTPNALTSRYGGAAGTGWATNTGGMVNIANQIVAATGWPCAVLNYSVGGSGLDASLTGGTGNWTSATAGQPYPEAKAGWQSVTSKVAVAIWAQGENDATSSISFATYAADLRTFIAKLRTDLGQAALPFIIAPLGKVDGYPGTTDAMWQDVRDALITVASDTDCYLGCATHDIAHDSLAAGDYSIHVSDAGAPVFGTRLGLSALVAMGLAAAGTNRGPTIASVKRVTTTKLNVTITHHAGSDFSPTTGITGFRVLDNGTPVTVSNAARLSPTIVRLTLASALTGAVGTTTVEHAYGMNPDVSAPLVDNSANTLPLEQALASGFAGTAAAVPSTPAAPSASAASKTSIRVSGALPANNGDPVSSVVLTASPGGATVTVNVSSTAVAYGGTFTGLTTGQSYTFTAHAVNDVGSSSESTASNAAVPKARGAANATFMSGYLRRR